MGVTRRSQEIYDALIGEVPVEDALVHTKYGDVLPPTRRWPAPDRTDRHGAPGIPSAGRAGQSKRSTTSCSSTAPPLWNY
ncbi:MAG: hypothetical protein ACLTYN_02805 [Dysosmobacter welbionis]